MTDLFLAALGGLAIGALFFEGLRWTVRVLPRAAHPAPLLLGSVAGRMALAALGFWWIGRGHWERMLACLAGFLIARFLVSLHDAMSRPVRGGSESWS